jgi:hypothetical protein
MEGWFVFLHSHSLTVQNERALTKLTKIIMEEYHCARTTNAAAFTEAAL